MYIRYTQTQGSKLCLSTDGGRRDVYIWLNYTCYPTFRLIISTRCFLHFPILKCKHQTLLTFLQSSTFLFVLFSPKVQIPTTCCIPSSQRLIRYQLCFKFQNLKSALLLLVVDLTIVIYLFFKLKSLNLMGASSSHNTWEHTRSFNTRNSSFSITRRYQHHPYLYTSKDCRVVWVETQLRKMPLPCKIREQCKIREFQVVEAY